MVLAADGGVAQQQVAASVDSNGSSLTLANIKAPKNGYAYVYVSNQSNNDVYFDNLQAGIVQGNIAEENHYYAYGLKIAGISSKKLGDTYEGQLKNNYLYQGAYSELDDDIGWHDFYLRNYDAQIGRWVQQDPYQEYASPYVGMGDDPINNTDPSGGSTLPYQAIKLGGEMSQTAITAITLGEVVVRTAATTTRAISGFQLIMSAGIYIAKSYRLVSIISGGFGTNLIGNSKSPYFVFSRQLKKTTSKVTYSRENVGTDKGLDQKGYERIIATYGITEEYNVILKHRVTGKTKKQKETVTTTMNIVVDFNQNERVLKEEKAFQKGSISTSENTSFKTERESGWGTETTTGDPINSTDSPTKGIVKYLRRIKHQLEDNPAKGNSVTEEFGDYIWEEMWQPKWKEIKKKKMKEQGSTTTPRR